MLKTLVKHCVRQNAGFISCCCYRSVTSEDVNKPYVIDLRSDTATKPTKEMRDAMASAKVGDDCFKEDPTVNELQSRVAKLLGTEDALLMPSGCMANLVAALSHCQNKYCEVILGDQSHMFLYEVGGMAQYGGLQTNIVKNLGDGTLDLDQISSHIRPADDRDQPQTELICLENTQNQCGGRVLPLNYLKEAYSVAKKHNIKLHMDGARVLNAATHLGVPPSDVTQYCDSVMTSFSKGLACPMGSVLAGSKDFIARAFRVRKSLGGGLHQAGILAACMLVALDTTAHRLHEDHQRARMIAEGVIEVSSPAANVDMDGVDTNIVMIDINKEGVSTEDFCNRLAQVTEAESVDLGERIVTKMFPFTKKSVRLVTHNDISDDDVRKTVKKLQYVIREISA
ncbi:probable low-specificity L-threonine aldolase 2 [Gigantopelta aegis]|uniref:probable low-specificity L-threonine aldolase 2 n=1 Tax=Gigantopelta aegis TaxID=1735272 RepID=UPI001B888EB2|nr:probable low-specificity L-threonine aldolase 2 [Gigantopelta aegis]